ncbi:MAG: protein-glutamate O-methyltransferase CheR [Sandaracinaceae bacterium]
MVAASAHDGLSTADFQRLREGCRGLFGVTIPEGKKGLAEARLKSLARSLGGKHDVKGLVRAFVSGNGDPGIRTGIVDALTTNHTYFMRETDHFDLFTQRVLPQLEKELGRSRDLRMWCAAAATGEEPWTLAMLLREHFGSSYKQWQAGLLASDISTRALAVARDGVYSEEAVGRLSSSLRERYFEPAGKDLLRVKDKLRKDTVFRRFNLASETWNFRRKFDVVFCRNVLIYFEGPEMDAVIEKMAACIRPGGWLFIGMAETLRRDQEHFEFVSTGAYRRRS